MVKNLNHRDYDIKAKQKITEIGFWLMVLSVVIPIVSVYSLLTGAFSGIYHFLVLTSTLVLSCFFWIPTLFEVLDLCYPA